MQTDEAKEVYKLRASTIETVNGDLKDHRGLTRFRVRGLQRVQCVLAWTDDVGEAGPALDAYLRLPFSIRRSISRAFVAVRPSASSAIALR